MVSTHVFLLAIFADILGSVRIIQNTLLIIIFTTSNDLILDGYHKSSSGKCTSAVSHAFNSNLWTSGVARSYACIPCKFLKNCYSFLRRSDFSFCCGRESCKLTGT
jgi:hypothetical protein